MKIILNADLAKVGRKGDVVEVADGYARNFLLPRNLAILATKGAIKQGASMARAREELEKKEKVGAEEIAAKIGSTTIKITARAGEDGQLFGSVTTTDIAKSLTELLGQEIDRRKIVLDESIRSVGTHEYRVHLHSEVSVAGSIEVVSE